MCDALTHPHLTGTRPRAKPRSKVECTAAIAAVDGHGLARIEADADAQRQQRVERDFVGERQLKLDGRAKRVARRAEDGKRLVAAQLDHTAPPSRASSANAAASRAAASSPCSCVKGRVAADVRNDKRQDRRSLTGTRSTNTPIAQLGTNPAWNRMRRSAAHRLPLSLRTSDR
jgi:hypothetical protein